jgi:hypothetical protein
MELVYGFDLYSGDSNVDFPVLLLKKSSSKLMKVSVLSSMVLVFSPYGL